MKKIKLGNKGFTLVEILVAAALIGGLGLAMMNIFKIQSFTQKKTEASFELSTLKQTINTTLLDANACKNTLSHIPNITTPGLTLTSVKDKTISPPGTPGIVFQTGVSYGNLVEIETINIVNAVVDPPVGASTKRFGSLQIVFHFKKTSKIIEKTKTTDELNLLIKVETDLGGRVTNCYSALETAVDTAKEESCEAIGGVFNVATNKCDLTNFGSTPNNTDATSTKFLEDYMNNYLTNVLDPRYVNVTGDTMTGSLAMNGANITISGGNLVQSSGYMSTDQYLTISDKRLKKKIKDISQEKLNQLHQIKTHEFVWKRENRKDYGFIAQEIEKIFPELVITNPTTGFKAVQYVSLVPIMLEEVQQLRKENTALKEENAKMKRDIEEIKQHLNLK